MSLPPREAAIMKTGQGGIRKVEAMDICVQFSVFLINKPGVLGAITTALAEAKINIIALALMDSGEHGALRFICDKPDKAREVLARTHDTSAEAEVLAVTLDNRPGAFAAVARLLAEAHINISYAYCTGGARGGHTTGVFKVSDLKKAQKLLGTHEQNKAQANKAGQAAKSLRKPHGRRS
jgi:hypothetical protein